MNCSKVKLIIILVFLFSCNNSSDRSQPEENMTQWDIYYSEKFIEFLDIVYKMGYWEYNINKTDSIFKNSKDDRKEFLKDCKNHEYIIKLYKPLIKELSLTLFNAEKYDSIPLPSKISFYDKNNNKKRGNWRDYFNMYQFFIDYTFKDCEGNVYKDYKYLTGFVY
ncbi:hypothetical protein N8249_02170 [Flavobacteriaceae bacterium]|nr:hypothetical protein [Flavobacteriaceae bacterium]